MALHRSGIIEISQLYNHTHIVYNLSMIVNKEKSYLAQIRKLLSEQNGTLLTSDLAQLNIPRTYLSILEQNGEIERVTRGVFQTTGSIVDELFVLQARYKSSIYSHETALYLHDLTDRTPLVYSFSVPVGYHSISLIESGHKIYYVSRKHVNLGVETIQSPQGNELRVTGLERTITDMIRSRNQMDVQAVNEALKRYVRRNDKNLYLLYDYARQFRVQKKVREYIEVLL